MNERDDGASPLDPGATGIAWCPGCGNFGIRNVLLNVLAGSGIRPEKIVIVSGIGQAAKIPHYVRTHFFNGLHGRALPPATAIKAANPSLTVIAESGDGDMYGEGGNHFIHTIRRNPGIVNIVHNNMVYGLTKGQASPTSQRGFKTPIQVGGVVLEPFNPLAVAIALDASFVARAYIGNLEQTAEIFRAALEHGGYALVDVFQPCVSFNKVNTYAWFEEHTAAIAKDHDPRDRIAALQLSFQSDPFPVGIFYRSPEKPRFEETLAVHQAGRTPLYARSLRSDVLRDLVESFGA